MAEYTITAQPLIYQHDDASGTVVEGRQITFRDAQTGANGRVFVPLSLYEPAHVDAVIMADIAKIRAIHALGQ